MQQLEHRIAEEIGREKFITEYGACKL